MNKKPDDSYSTLQVIIFSGIVLDSYSVYSGWKQLYDDKAISGILGNQGLAAQGLDISATLASLQKMGTLLLLVFLIFDFVAYYYLSDYKNWARKYIMSIAIFYLVGCIFNFSLIYLTYGAFTLYFLNKQSHEFAS